MLPTHLNTKLSETYIVANGIRHYMVECGEGPLILLVHGFPGSWYSWRHQIPFLANLGYKVVAIDVRGYGETDCPTAIEDYKLSVMAKDLSEIIIALGYKEAFVIGHDWGAIIAQKLATLYPSLVNGIVSMSIPFLPTPILASTQAEKKKSADLFWYLDYFLQPNIPEKELMEDTHDLLLRLFYCTSYQYMASQHASENIFSTVSISNHQPHLSINDYLPQCTLQDMPWLTEQDLNYYTSRFALSGFKGPLNRYRCRELDWAEAEAEAEKQTRHSIQQPHFFIAGDHEVILTFQGNSLTKIEKQQQKHTNLKAFEIIANTGHWLTEESPTAVNEFLKQCLCKYN